MSATTDDTVLRLRQQGSPFSVIARQLGLERSNDAEAAYHRALRSRSHDEQTVLRRDEAARLKRMTARITDNEDLSTEERDDQLQAVEQMRARLLSV